MQVSVSGAQDNASNRVGAILQERAGAHVNEDEQVMARCNHKHVLVIDHDHKSSRLLALQLIRDGFAVSTAADGLEALEQLHQHGADVVVTDFRLPDMDGLEFLSVCRVKWPGTPVVVFSGGQDDIPHEAIDRGAYAWVRKGREFSTLLEVLTSAVLQSVHA